MTENIDEAEVIRRVCAGDRSAFTLLYSRYLNNLYRYIYLFTKDKDVSEEIVQNVFINIWIRREKLNNVTSFKAYLYKSAKNMLLDEIKRKQVQAKVMFAIKPATEESYEVSDGRVIYNQYYKIAEEAINRLPAKRKQIIVLRTKDELTLDEIAERLSISKNVVKKQLYAGMNSIRAYLQKYGELTHLLIPFIFLVDENNNLF